MTTNKPKTFTACDLSTGRSECEAMTDRELLELAAKAAGTNIFDWTPGGHPTANGSWDGIWNPLEDDGDALRLAVRLNLLGAHSDGHAIGAAGMIDADPYAATRRAIVRAAAEMVRDKP